MYTYTPRGVCSRRIDIQLDGDTVKDVVFTGGCNGNLRGHLQNHQRDAGRPRD